MWYLHFPWNKGKQKLYMQLGWRTQNDPSHLRVEVHHSYKYGVTGQGRNQTLNLRWEREEHFLISPLFSPVFPQFFLIFFLNLVLRSGGSPTLKAPGYTPALWLARGECGKYYDCHWILWLRTVESNISTYMKQTRRNNIVRASWSKHIKEGTAPQTNIGYVLCAISILPTRFQKR